MSMLEDWINLFSKPADDFPYAKEFKRLEEINHSIVSGNGMVDFEHTPLARIEKEIEAINKKLEIEHQARLEADKTAKKQAVTDRNRFIFNTVIGIVSAVAAVIGAVFAAVSFFS